MQRNETEQAIHIIANEFCSDYPGVNTCTPKEQLYAIKESMIGICLANDDLHKVINVLMKHCDMSMDDYVEFIKDIKGN